MSDDVRTMTGRTCHHCKQLIEPGEAHDCWTTTEEALTEELSEDLREAWERVRETAAAYGEQRIYASHHCIMFARRTAYFFVRPKRSYLELCLFLDHTVQSPQIRSVKRVSSTRLAHIVRVKHPTKLKHRDRLDGRSPRIAGRTTGPAQQRVAGHADAGSGEAQDSGATEIT